MPMLLKQMEGLFCKSWCEEWVVLYEDSTLAWFADKALSRLRGSVRICDAPDLLAVGEWTKKVPRRPRLSHVCHVGQLLAIGCRKRKQVHWLMAATPADINDWMTAISNTLPPPPHIPLEEKRLTLTSYPQNLPNGRAHSVSNGYATPIYSTPDLPATITSKVQTPNGKVPSSMSNKKSISQVTNAVNNYNLKNRQLDRLVDRKMAKSFTNDYTVLEGVVIWGHGWGWNQSAILSTTTCGADTAMASTISCHTAGDDCTMSGYDADMDWSVFGDFCF